ncbi:39S ribosomal protein L33, mitochondrial-like [Carcharodon carcharias]|uniref:39S ribosomal protein L33, mitochondrial-like n=1 Tax=Carcharodon carcharias TaxID=13397 RepID=UPI001B7EB872|nr:39S ribosomal protein L33, mitochondrial-like [Carcharodon carcharias]
MLLTTVNFAKSKSKSTLVRVVSTAGSGCCFKAKRSQLLEKLVLRNHDPTVSKHALFFEKEKISQSDIGCLNGLVLYKDSLETEQDFLEIQHHLWL